MALRVAAVRTVPVPSSSELFSVALGSELGFEGSGFQAEECGWFCGVHTRRESKLHRRVRAQ